MTTQKQSTPKPRKKARSTSASSFQARVDYVAKALRKGTWGSKFDECFEHHDSNHLIAIVMHRAERNIALQEAITQCFRVQSWADVPWHEQARPFAGMSSQQIGTDAERIRSEQEQVFRDLYRNPEKIMDESA